MIPLRDENPTYRTPVLTVAFIIICVLAFLMQIAGGPQEAQRIILSYGLIPGVLLGSVELPPELAVIPPALTLVTSMFMHGGWMHIIGNMLFLWIFGNNIEDVLGHVRFLIFYLLCGLAAAASQILVAPASQIPMVGASGAISGVLGAYIILFPRARVLTLVFLGFFVTTVRIEAVWFLGIWFGMQLIQGLAAPPDAGGVAFWAHIGGFAAGVVLLFLMKPRKRTVFTGRRGPWG